MEPGAEFPTSSIYAPVVVQVELRKAVRYRLDLPVTYRWAAELGEDRLGMGFTRDISSSALFVFSEQCPPPDAYVSCEVMLPRLQGPGFCQIIATGRVVRIEQDVQPRVYGFALSGDMLLLSSELAELREKGSNSEMVVSANCKLSN
jgi:hypothetical protein